MEEITPKNLLTYLSIERKLKGMDKKVVFVSSHATYSLTTFLSIPFNFLSIDK